jgi:DUF4097 and DUF4098 domain-containing protein YvlB
MRKLALLALGVSCLVAAEAPPFDWRGSIPGGRTLDVRGVNGNIRTVLAPGSEVEVNAIRTARRSDPNQVRVEVENKGGDVVICVIYPNESNSGCDRGQNTKNNDTRVDFTIRLPKDVRLAARTVNGNVLAEKLHSPITAKTVNGRIELNTTQSASAESVNGSINATMGTLASEARFSSVNGSIDLSLPPTAGANLNASVVNGDITPDFPITLSGKISKRELNGRLGNGGPELVVKTVNGSIHIRQNKLI